MATLTIRLPDTHRDRLAAMAARHGLSLNKLMVELSIRALAEHNTEMRFRMRDACGEGWSCLTNSTAGTRGLASANDAEAERSARMMPRVDNGTLAAV